MTEKSAKKGKRRGNAIPVGIRGIPFAMAISPGLLKVSWRNIRLFPI
jgi:hypothetical protein